MLFTTASFDALSTPTATADFAKANIPSSYLAAGSLTFENAGGSLIYWGLSWGGASYTGSNAGSTTNDADGNFGPPFPDPLPATGRQALTFSGSFSALSTTNSDDYALDPAPFDVINNAGSGFTVEGPNGIGDKPVSVQPVILPGNHPNPFNPATTVTFTLRQQSRVELRIHAADGRLGSWASGSPPSFLAADFCRRPQFRSWDNGPAPAR